MLSLSLAFILSQDQTLRCLNCIFTYPSARIPCLSQRFLCLLTVSNGIHPSIILVLLLVALCNFYFSLRYVISSKNFAIVSRLRVQRYALFPYFQIFRGIFSRNISQGGDRVHYIIRDEKTPPAGREKRRSPPPPRFPGSPAMPRGKARHIPGKPPRPPRRSGGKGTFFKLKNVKKSDGAIKWLHSRHTERRTTRNANR